MLKKIIAFFAFLDGKKTYIFSIMGALAAIIHFIAVGDFSLTALSALMAEQSMAGVAASLRHAFEKTTKQEKPI